MDQLEFVRQNINEHISFFRRKRNYNRRMAQVFVVAAATLSAISTIGIGISEALDIKWFIILALIASGLATVVGTWQALLAHKRLWEINNSTLADLEELKRAIDYRCADSTRTEKAEADDFFARFDNIVREADDAWVKTYATKTGKS